MLITISYTIGGSCSAWIEESMRHPSAELLAPLRLGAYPLAMSGAYADCSDKPSNQTRIA